MATYRGAISVAHRISDASRGRREQAPRLARSLLPEHTPTPGILGRTLSARYAEGEKVRVTEDELRAALTVRARRRVRRDTMIRVDGVVYDVPLGYLAGQTITVATSLFDGTRPCPGAGWQADCPERHGPDGKPQEAPPAAATCSRRAKDSGRFRATAYARRQPRGGLR